MYFRLIYVNYHLMLLRKIPGTLCWSLFSRFTSETQSMVSHPGQGQRWVSHPGQGRARESLNRVELRFFMIWCLGTTEYRNPPKGVGGIFQACVFPWTFIFLVYVSLLGYFYSEKKKLRSLLNIYFSLSLLLHFSIGSVYKKLPSFTKVKAKCKKWKNIWFPNNWLYSLTKEHSIEKERWQENKLNPNEFKIFM